jgi:hypothetical protein
MKPRRLLFVEVILAVISALVIALTSAEAEFLRSLNGVFWQF